MTKITVIVPLYYGKKYLDKILKMVQRNQEQVRNEADIELILINDSPAESVSMEDILGSYAFDIQILCNEDNRGIHYSRVKGLEKANGEFVTFLDQDDAIADNFFLSQLRCMKETDDIIVANGIAEYVSHKKLLYRYWFMQWTVKHIWFYAKFDCRIISPGQCLIRKSSIPEIWTKKIMTKNGADDYFLWLVMHSQGKRFGINREILYTHRYTSENLSEDKNKMNQSVGELLFFVETLVQSKYVKMIRERVSRNGENVLHKLLVMAIEGINKE